MSGTFSAYAPVLDSVSHFRIHVLVLLAAIAAVFAVMKFWRRAAVSVIGVVLGGTTLGPVLSVLPSAKASRDIRVISFNVNFRNRRIEALLKTIQSERPDFLAFQEITRRNESVLALLKPYYPAQKDCFFSAIGRVVVLSRFKAVANQSSGCIENQGLVWMTVQRGERRVTIASLHLHWPWPYGQDQQIRKIYGELQRLPRPLILAGDFNAAPWSAAVKRIATATKTQVVPGLRFTIRVRPFRYSPTVPMPIDHVLTTHHLRPVAARTLKPSGSDHRPVLVDLKWR